MPGQSARAQTGVDFITAMGVFMVAVGFVIGFVPDIIAPFQAGQADALVVDRAASALADGVLGDPSNPSVLNTTCTVAFFGHGAATGCAFDAGDELTDRVGIDSQYKMNVTLERGTGNGQQVLCTDGDVIQSCDEGGDELATGPPAPGDRASVVHGQRAVYVDADAAVLVVRIW